jgi:4-amino-4-deoxy-L-arabinose transferase-like glycosyltransferase
MLVQALLGVLAIFLVYFISRSVMPAVWALLPSALVAISPKLIIAGTYILTETLFTTMLLVSLAWIVLLSRRQSSIWVPLIGGVLLSATALVRPTLQYVLPFILMAIIPLLSSRQKWRYGGAMLLGFLLVATPWIVRNVISTGRMSDPTLMISSLVHGHYPFMMFNFQVESLGYPYRFDPDIAEISKSTSAAISGITKRAAESPALYLAWYLIGKPIAFLSWTDPVAAAGVFTYPVRQSPYLSDPLFIWTLAVMKVTHWLWIALGVFAAIFALMPRLVNSLPVEGSLALRVLSFTCIYFIFIHVVGLPIARYSIPLMPVIFILSGYGAYQLYLRGMASWRASAHASA